MSKHNFVSTPQGEHILIGNKNVQDHVNAMLQHPDSEVLLCVVRLNDNLGVSVRGAPNEEMLAILQQLTASYAQALRRAKAPGHEPTQH